MAFDARKVKDEAALAVTKGRWKKALECYLMLERAEPRDGSWPQKAGEMNRKLNRLDDAVAAWTRAADRFAGSGFLLKAIAVCKLILDVEPGHQDTQTRLASLYAARGAPPAPKPRPRTLPPGATLDQISVGRVVQGTRVDPPSVFEIPLEPSPARSAAMAILPRTPLFSSLDAAALKLLIERVKAVRLEAGQELFAQGDRGDALYVVSEGEVAAVVDGREVGRLREGSFFGEVALVTDQPRSATIRAVQTSELLAIDRVTISDLIETSPDVLKTLLAFMRDRLLDTLMDTNRLFAPFSGEDRRTLAARFKFLEVDAGATFVEQGRRAPGLFVILAGQVDVKLDGRTIAALGPGDLFGEMSLLHGSAVASVVASARTYLIELPRSDFQEVIMTHPQVLEYLASLAEERRKLV